MKIVALIPLRGGSKSIPHKNIKVIGGKTLAYWTCQAANQASFIDEVWVSTDDEQIKKTVLAFGMSKLKVIDRPSEFATDTASTESVMLHFAENVDFDLLVTLQATSPLTEAQDLEKAYDFFKKQSYDSLLTGVVWKRFFWKKDGTPVNYDPLHRPRRQEFDGWIMENGAFYFTKKDILQKYQNRLGGKIGVYVMPEEMALELDEPTDWEIISHILEKRESNDL